MMLATNPKRQFARFVVILSIVSVFSCHERANINFHRMDNCQICIKIEVLFAKYLSNRKNLKQFIITDEIVLGLTADNGLPSLIGIGIDYSNSPDVQKKYFSNIIFRDIYQIISKNADNRERVRLIESHLIKNIEEFSSSDSTGISNSGLTQYVCGAAFILGNYYANVPNDKFHYPFFESMMSQNKLNIAHAFLYGYWGREKLTETMQNDISELIVDLDLKMKKNREARIESIQRKYTNAEAENAYGPTRKVPRPLNPDPNSAPPLKPEDPKKP